jgi:hypothetical protein
MNFQQNIYILVNAFSFMANVPEAEILKEPERYSFGEYVKAAFSNTGDMMKKIVERPRPLFFIVMISIIAALSALSSYIAYTRVKISIIWPENLTEEMRSFMEYAIQLSTNPAIIAVIALLVVPIVYAMGAVIIWIIGLMKAKISSVLTAMGIIGIPSIFSEIFKMIASLLSPVREITLDLRGGAPSGTPSPNYADLLIDIVFLPWEAYLIYQLFRSGIGKSMRGSLVSVLIAEAIKYAWTLAGFVRV